MGLESIFEIALFTSHRHLLQTHISIKLGQRKIFDVLCPCYSSLRPTKQSFYFAEKIFSSFESNCILYYVEYNSK